MGTLLHPGVDGIEPTLHTLGRRSLLQEETVEVTEVLEAERRGRKESPLFTTPPLEVTLNWRRRHTPVLGSALLFRRLGVSVVAKGSCPGEVGPDLTNAAEGVVLRPRSWLELLTVGSYCGLVASGSCSDSSKLLQILTSPLPPPSSPARW